MFERALILGLYSITPVHAGSGAELSIVDLPIQRERHTGFPTIWGQSLKGVLRSRFRHFEMSKQIVVNGKNWDWEQKTREILGDKAEEFIKKVKSGKRDPILTEIVFGPATEGASEHGGAVSVGDAKILLFPVRSLKGVFAYVTCPLVLNRLQRDFELTGIDEDIKIPNVEGESAIVDENSSLVVDKKVVIEDIALNAEPDKNVQEISEILSKISPIGIDSEKVAIVPDDLFTNIVQMATEIVARVKISAETGTVERGGLWYEEYLPSDSLLYSVVAIGKPKKAVKGLSTTDLAKLLGIFDGKFIQVGGNETVGKGFVKVKVYDGQQA